MGSNLVPNCNGPALPVELYQKIFGLVFEMDVEHFEDLDRVCLHVRTPFTLGAVCMRWRNVVLGMPELWTFMYCKPLPFKPESAKNLRPGARSRVMRYLRFGQRDLESPSTCSSNVQSLFLERCANSPLRIYILRMNRCPSLADQIPSLDLFPSHRIRQISLRNHDLDKKFSPGNNLLFTLIRLLDLLKFRLQGLPALEIIDMSADTFRRSTRVIFHRDPVCHPNDSPKLLKVAIYGELFSLWHELLAGDPTRLTHLTLSNTGLENSQTYMDLFDLMGSSLTYLHVANVFWGNMMWDELFARLTNLTSLRLELTKPVTHLQSTVSGEVYQASRLESALLDKLPTVVNSLTRLSEIELITNVPVRAGGLIRFIMNRLQSVEAEVGRFRVVVSRSTFTPSEINLLRGVSIVEIV
jgi:F-box-like